MESLGEKLKTTRNEKGLSLDQISKDTNISIRYLEAMEMENFEIFPGEPYVLGFIRSYGSYLDLDVTKLISLYKAFRIQEQPIPKELIKEQPKLPKFLIPLFIILIVIGGGGYGIYYFIKNRPAAPVQAAPEVRTPVEYLMEGNTLERRFYRSDSILIPVDNETYKLEISNLGETVTIRSPEGSRSLDLGQEITIDLNNDGIPELRITVADFAKNNADMGALLHFILMDTAVFTGAEIYAGTSAPAVTTSAASSVIIPGTVSAYPFTLQVNFQGYCMFRWEIISERDRPGTNENFFQRGEQLDIQAQNGIRIWSSNATAARFQVIGGGRTYPVEIGGAGEVVVAEVRWIRDEEGRYRLVVIRLEI